jgi:phage shock protein E
MPMKSVSAILTIVVLLSLTLACHAGNADPAAVHAKIKAGAMVVDVRTPAEFASGAYQGAINIPLDQVEKRLADFGDRKRPIVLYCRSGHRAGLAKAILESNGFSDVTNGGGLKDMPPR